jgi:signal peptidase I
MSNRRVLTLGALAGLLIIAGLYLWLGPYYVEVPTRNMEPTIRPGERVVVNSIVGTVGRGDLIMFRHPTDTGVLYFKRVAGVGGDLVQLRGARVIVNGEPLRERRVFVVYGDDGETLREVGEEGEGEYSVYYAEAEPPGGRESPDAAYAVREPYRVPRGSLFTLGDNRDYSMDSRYWGTVPVANVVGRPSFVYAVETEEGLSLTYRALR